MGQRGRRPYPDILTPRQQEVLRLLREGLSNEDIGRRLGVSRDAAKYHVSEILSRLGVASREEAAAWRPPAKKWWTPGALLAPLQTIGRGIRIAAAVAASIAAVVLLLYVWGVFGSREQPPPGPGAAAEETARPGDGQPAAAATAPGFIAPPGSLPAGLSGKLAFVQNGDLWVMDFPAGPAKLIRPGLGAAAGGLHPGISWSPSGDWLLIDDTVLRADGALLRTKTPCYSWSPTEDVLLCRDDSTNRFELQTPAGVLLAKIDTKAPPPTQARGGPTIGDAVWSADGRLLAYSVHGQATFDPYHHPSSLWVVNADGTGARKLFETDGDEVRAFGFSRDGSQVLFQVSPSFSASALSDGLGLYSVPAQGGTPVKVTSMSVRKELFGGSAPSGVLAITDGTRRDMWTNKRIAVLDPASGSLVRLTSSDDAAFSPAWSPDGSKLAYVSGPDVGDVVGGDPAKQAMALRRIWLMDAGGANKRQLTDDSAYRDERPLWTSDGSWVIFSRIDAQGIASVWAVDSEGGSPVQIAGVSRPLEPPCTPRACPFWFGYYGYIAWNDFFAYWPGP